MKTQTSTFARTAILLLLSLCSLAASSHAAAKPLNYPYGLAVDAKGNLYVANSNSNEILIYNPAHAQQTAKTITNKVAGPSGLAFDAFGTLWVANQTTNVINAYSSAGALLPADSITNSINSPQFITFDGIGNLWVNNGFTSLAAYPVFSGTPILSQTSSTPITGLASWNMFLSVGENNSSARLELGQYLTNNGGFAGAFPQTCYAMAYDKLGNLYCGNQDRTLTVMSLSGTVKTITNLGFFPTGLALDTAHSLAYVANGPGNTIAVYNTTTGTLVTTIH